MKSLKDQLTLLGSSIVLSGMLGIIAFPSAATAADEVRINDSSGLLLGAAALSTHREASVVVAVDSAAGSTPVELSLTGTFQNSSVRKASVNNGTASFSGVGAGSYLLQASPENVKIVSVKIQAGEEQASKGSNVYLNAAAVAAAAAGTTGLIIGGSNIDGSDDGSVVISSDSPAGGEAGGSISASSGGMRGNPGSTRVSSRVASSAPPIGSISPAPGSNNTTLNPTPNTGGPGGPLPGGDNPTGSTPNFPTPNNPPPLSGS